MDKCKTTKWLKSTGNVPKRNSSLSRIRLILTSLFADHSLQQLLFLGFWVAQRLAKARFGRD
jgi:glucose-6-phosphate dehydrogenase assembly protein OpcA